jgi:hypothetical protein
MEIIYEALPIMIGEAFIYKGSYCICRSYSQNGLGFWYEIQAEPERKNYMSFRTYIETPSYKGKNQYRKKY